MVEGTVLVEQVLVLLEANPIIQRRAEAREIVVFNCRRIPLQGVVWRQGSAFLCRVAGTPRKDNKGET